MIGVTGIRSTIIKELSEYDDVTRITTEDIGSDEIDWYVLASGVIQPKTWLDQSLDELQETFRVNVIDTITVCEKILANKSNARICIIGSASGFRSSFDMAYAVSKAAIHSYVKMKHLGPCQKLFAVAPWIIKDSNMAKRRHDYDRIKDGPYITSDKVAEAIYGGLKDGVSGDIIKLY